MRKWIKLIQHTAARLWMVALGIIAAGILWEQVDVQPSWAWLLAKIRGN